MKLVVLPDERFSCHSCTNCCRDWHVELLGDEAEKIQALAWNGGDPLSGARVLLRHAGRTFLAHQPDGSCIFLNSANGLCRIHEQFGADAKPLGCRLFPFQIVPTFQGEATVTARFDCPTARRNEGTAHADALAQLKQFADQLPLPGGFDERVCRSFDGDQIEAVCDFAVALMAGFERNDQRALFIAFLADWLSAVKPADLDRAALAGAFGKLKERVESATAAPAKCPGIMHRVAFRTLLGLHLRRDEDVLNGRAGRMSRVNAMILFVFGAGGFHGLGLCHPRGKLRAARLFRAEPDLPDTNVFELHWRMIRTKLTSYQFFGSANGGRDVILGLRSLALLYPLVLAAARYRAGSRGAALIDESDVDYAVGAIEHSFGRSAILTQPFARVLEAFLLENAVFIALARMI